MINELPERLRAISESVNDWDNPLGAREDLLDAAYFIRHMQEAIKQTIDENRHLADGDDCTLFRLKKCIEDCNDNTCKWTKQVNYDVGMWEAECGDVALVGDERPSDNGMRYCYYCGRRIIEKVESE